MQIRPQLKICLIGPPRVLCANGIDRTPKGRKARALLAMLALSPQKRCARKWLQDRLWSDRADEQGAASLRQCLTEIRKAFGNARHLIQADNSTVQLDEPNVSIDVDEFVDGDEILGPGRELLEGLDVRDQEFEDWLREQRSWFDSRCSAWESEDEYEANAKKGRIDKDNKIQPELTLTKGLRQDTAARTLVADCLVDTVTKTLSEIGQLHVIDERTVISNGTVAPPPPRPAQPIGALELKSDIIGDDRVSTIRLQLTRKHDGRTVWTDSLQIPQSDELSLDDPTILGRLNHVVYSAIEELIDLDQQADQNMPFAPTLCYNGIQYFFRLGSTNWQVADQLFSRAYDVDPRGVYLAWRAYLRTFQLAERKYKCRDTVLEEAQFFIRRALEDEGMNSFVQAIAAQVQLLVHRSYIAAYEFAEQSINLNRANPLAWGLLGMAECNLGRPDEGFSHTLRARQIAGTAPFRFHIDGMCCIAATVAGRFDQAIIHGEASHAAAATYAPPLRYLTALYHARTEEEKSLIFVKKMQKIETDFSYAKLRDASYPAASMRRSRLFADLPVSCRKPVLSNKSEPAEDLQEQAGQTSSTPNAEQRNQSITAG